MNMHGNNPEKVVQALKSGQPVALVVEGGGMRGAISAGALWALHHAGLAKRLAAIYAVSAGAVNAAFLLSGQGEKGISVYFNHMNNIRFFNPLRFWKVVDIDYIYDHVVPNIMNLDELSVRQSSTSLNIGVTDCDTGKQQFIHANTTQLGLCSLLKASSALPVLYNKPVTINGRQFLDGGIPCSIALSRALQDGHQNIICALTRPLGYRSSAPGVFDRTMFSLFVGRRFPLAFKSYKDAWQRNNNARQISEGNSNESANILALAPNGSLPQLSRLTLSRPRLIEAAKNMAIATAKVFGEDTDTVAKDFALKYPI